MASSAKTSFRRASGLVVRIAFLLLGLLAMAPAAQAHVGSPDIYAEGSAGPYRLLVTIRPPQVIPGVAEIEVRSVSPDVQSISITPIPLIGEASKHPPVADAMKQSTSDKSFFTGTLWIMSSGSWQVRFAVQAAQGSYLLSIPVPATASATQGMQAGLGVILGTLGLVLMIGLVGIVGAAARDAQLPPGTASTQTGRRKALIAMAVMLTLVVAAAVFGRLWWNNEAGDYARYVYKPLTMTAALEQQDIPALELKIEDPGWIKARRLDDFVLDHDHLMHLYLLREPGLDLVYHLHPEQTGAGSFCLFLPSVPAGDYRLYADVVHANGFPETLVSSLTLPEIKGRPLAGDDAEGTEAPTNPAACSTGKALPDSFRLPDGFTMHWNRPSPLKAKASNLFEFTLLDGASRPPADMALYMGMLGHAAFVKDDGSVFAHVHPSGTVSMAALMMAAQQNQSQNAQQKPAAEPMADMPGMAMHSTSALPNQVAFPYGFPTPGTYRVFVQMKHGATIETAAFDACVQ